MTTFSSHLLNSGNGSHASNVEIEIYQIKSNGERKIFYKTKTDNTGRVLKEFDLDPSRKDFWELGIKIIKNFIDELEKLS